MEAMMQADPLSTGDATTGHQVGQPRGAPRAKRGIEGSGLRMTPRVRAGARSMPGRSGPAQSVAAWTAAPSSPARLLRITRTGIPVTSSSIGALSRNARMKPPARNAGRILGGMPPPM